MTKTQQETLNDLLKEAVEKNDTTRAKLCIEKGADIHHQVVIQQYIKTQRGEQGSTLIKSPLFFLIIRQAHFSAAMADLFIANGVDINNIKDTKGNTPLLISVLTQDEEPARYLIAKGARTDVVNADGMSPLSVTENLDTLLKHNQTKSYRTIFTEMILKAMPVCDKIQQEFEDTREEMGLKEPLARPKKVALRKAPTTTTPPENQEGDASPQKRKFRL